MSNQEQKTFDVAYLGMVPVEHKSEGLNVLLCDTIKPLMEQGVQVRIHTTNRHTSSIRDAMEGNGVDMSRVDMVSYRVKSIALIIIHALWNFLKKKKKPTKKPGMLRSFLSWSKEVGKSVSVRLLYWVSDLTPWNFIPKALIGTALVLLGLATVLVIGLVLIVPAIIAAVLLVTLMVAMLAYPRVKRKLVNRGWVRSNKKRAPDAPKSKKNSNFLLQLHGHLYEQELIRFASAVNRNKSVKKLFFFTAFDGHAIKHFRGSTIAVFPDMVSSLFPTRFATMHNAPQLASMHLTLKHADVLVCYSEFVRDQQLCRLFPEETRDKRIEVIPQGYFSAPKSAKLTRDEARREMNKHKSLVINCFPMLLQRAPVVDFTQFEYIIYPTIDRPHKNTLTLVRAFAKLLRERHRNIKLVLTTPAPTEDVKNFIIAQRLQYDTLFIPSVPIKILDLLFQGASLMVHPSLAEGGDIFNFSRAAAANTPALLADIPVVREMFERRGIARQEYQDWTFDPTDTAALTERIDAILADPTDIGERQRDIASQLSEYGFTEMANRYLELYETY